MENNFFKSTFGYKLIYIFRINDELHKDILKIGDATLHTYKKYSDFPDNCNELNIAAIKRINRYTKTAGIVYELLYTSIAVNNEGKAFRDYSVHDVLKRSNIHTKYLNGSTRNEWYIVDLNTAKNAINACKQCRSYINSNEKSTNRSPIVLRPEQQDAVEKTIKNFKTSNRMLWNAKMRFGKTICALEIVKRENYKRTIILTHRPVVDDGWFDDFNKIFDDDNSYLYGSKNKGESIEKLLSSGKKFVYFASMQDMGGSQATGGKFVKNDNVFDTQWDFVIIDEAHEGTKTERGERTIDGVIKISDNYPTKLLELSGTPFKIISDYSENEIYTWDYVMEQLQKHEWEINHNGDSNPYEELPQMNIYTYDLNKNFRNYIDYSDKSFNFREFFRTWTGNIEIDRKEIPNDKQIGSFIHEGDVEKFLDLLCMDDEHTNYPYSKDIYREYFRHSLWMVPGVKEAKALCALLRIHHVFGSGLFKIVNVAGNGDEEDTSKSKQLVDSAITDKPEETYTITVSCGRLTTGVSIPAWTAVFMLSGNNSTSASSYLQTIFRVQTPANIGGKIKDMCYVFDFAPDRTLKMMAEAGELSCKPGSIESKTKMGDLLNFCPVISVEGSRMLPYNVDTMLQTLKKAYADKVVRNGFDDTKIYNDKLLKLDGLELKEFEKLQDIVGSSKQAKKVDHIDINNQGLTDDEYEHIQEIKSKKRDELTDEDREILEKNKLQKDNAHKAISILRGISIRIPLLIYGADVSYEKEINIFNFTEIVDDASWKEFMPKGVTKEIFKQFSKYYDADIFVAAGNKIRNVSKYADTLSPLERTKEIANLFSTFKNPDKETVLTPWKTVNRHMGDCIGGYNFFDDKYLVTVEEPRYISHGEVTNIVLNDTSSKVLEINSKTGLYPLYITYSIFKQRCLDVDQKKLDAELEQALWNTTLEDNIFVICRTLMAKSITQRTLSGFNNYRTNILCYEDIVDRLIEPTNFINEIKRSNTWGKEGETMKFDAIVGNPPYQEIVGNDDNSSLGKQLFPTFVTFAIRMNPKYVSLITPSRWFAGDAQDKSFLKLREYIKGNNHISKIYNYPNCTDIFDNVVIKGGVSYFLYDKSYLGNVDFYTSLESNIELQNRLLFEENLDIILGNEKDYEIIKKIKNKDFVSFTTITKGRNAFGIVGKQNVVEQISKSNEYSESIKLQCKNEEIRWTDLKNVTKNLDVFKSYKVFISKSAGDPSKDKKIIGKPYLALPNTCCTDSLIPVGCFDNEIEALNLQKYMKTRFLRFMVSILKVSQNVYQNVYQFVPLQNFTNDSDINWSGSFDEIDNQLFEKYHFTNEEINYVNTKVSSSEY